MARNPKCEIMEKNPPWRDWLFSTNFRCCSLTFKRFSGLPSDLSSASNLVGGKVSSISGYGVLKYLWFFCVKRMPRIAPANCSEVDGNLKINGTFHLQQDCLKKRRAAVIQPSAYFSFTFGNWKLCLWKKNLSFTDPIVAAIFHPLFGSGKIEKSQAKAARNPGEFSVALWGYADAKKCLLLKIAPFSSSRTLPTSTLSPKILL